MLKRLFDITFAAAGLAVLWPVLLVVALVIKLDSRGPVFYRAKRAGRCGMPFYMYKFRTMISDAEKPGGDTTALNDPRITSAGRRLRRYKFDELPQLFNVLIGDMSVVGPRPELLYYTDRYSSEERQILEVRPGITDLSSITLHSLDEAVGAEDVDHIFETQFLHCKNALRLRYVRERSMWLDLAIIVRTALVLTRKLLRDAHRSLRGSVTAANGIHKA